MSHADFSHWISKNKKELVNSVPQKIALLVCECFFFYPQGFDCTRNPKRDYNPWGGGGGQMLPYMVYIGICCSEGDGFQAVYYGIGYRKQESLGLE